MIFYLLIVSFFLSLLLSFLFWKIGERRKIYDEASPDPLKIHKKSVSCLGGLAMFLSLLFILFLIMIQKEEFSCQIFGLMAAGLVIFLLGLADDLKWRDKAKIRPLYKFLFLVFFSFLATFILWSVGFGSGLLIFSAIFILINAVNYQDGMDGAAAGTTIISLIAFLVLGNDLAILISTALIPVVLGFLIFNFPPARIFMGDSGAYFLGFNLAVLSGIYLKPFDFFSFLAVAFILGLPLFDGVFTNIRRIIKGKSIFLGDRKHFFDRLLQKGLSVRKTLFICWIIQIFFAAIGLLIYEHTII